MSHWNSLFIIWWYLVFVLIRGLVFLKSAIWCGTRKHYKIWSFVYICLYSHVDLTLFDHPEYLITQHFFLSLQRLLFFHSVFFIVQYWMSCQLGNLSNILISSWEKSSSYHSYVHSCVYVLYSIRTLWMYKYNTLFACIVRDLWGRVSYSRPKFVAEQNKKNCHYQMSFKRREILFRF